MRAHQVAMPSPLGERNLPNLFPDLDSLAVEFSSKLMGQLREAWSATGLQAEMVEKNAIAIGLMLPFWRVGSLLELHELGWLTEIHLCDRSPKGELARLLEQWRKPDQTEGKRPPLTRTRNQAAASMTPKLLLEGIDYILSNPLSTGDALLAHLQKPKGIGPLN
eukprot:jgi/Chrpa1/26632/Chrysochromulina_OHIO_Genome00025744-RA